MTPEFFFPAALIIVALVTAAWWVNQRLRALQEGLKPDDNLVKIISDLQKLSPQLNSTLNQSTRDLNVRLDNAAKYIREVAKEVGQMNELGQSMRELQVFLQSPKLRGNIGEQVLKDLIVQSFPKGSFHLQYSFKSGDKVDAAVVTSAGILPIDSKFPLENFRKMTLAENKAERAAAKKEFGRDVKKHIETISQKYILPEEGTLDLAIMYIPSEAVYHEIAGTPELLEYAKVRRIYPVSPNTLYLVLQSLLLSFEGQKIEAKTKEIFRIMRAVQKDYEKTTAVMEVLGRHINNAYNSFSAAFKSFSLLGQKLASGQQLEITESKQFKKLKQIN
jgi:DNA recombination protein RmuC